jgi:transcription antitermination factor NusG
MLNNGKESVTMTSKAFEVGDQVRVVVNGFGRGTLGIVRSVDKNRRRTEPYYIYYVELPGEETLVDFEYRDLELVPADQK